VETMGRAVILVFCPG